MGCSGRGTFRMWDVWAAGCLGCEMLGMQGVSDVGCSIPEFLPKHSCTQQIATIVGRS